MPGTPLQLDRSNDSGIHEFGFPEMLRQSIRAFLFLRFQSKPVDRLWLYVSASMVFCILMQIVSDLIHVGAHGEFNVFGIVGCFFYIPITLVAATLVTKSCKQTDKTLSLLWLFAMLSVMYQFSYLLIVLLYEVPGVASHLPRWSRIISTSLIGLYALSCAIAAARLLNLRGRSAVFPTFLCICLLALPNFFIYRSNTLWMPKYDDSDYANSIGRYDALNTEEIFYLQPKLLDAELALIKPADGARSQIFFLGVAGYASQDVFANELKFVDQLFQERFHTDTHRMRLSNNPATVGQLPIASLTSLQRSLNALGKMMRPDRDVLFLYMTSHGSKTHEFSLDFGSMQFKKIDPQSLKTALDIAGIRHRVIVVSACYSGGYIDALKNENSLIITSAAKDKTSFGCSNDAEFTYFGKAYFVDALREDISFVEAFEKAQPRILERERQEDYTPSDPQIFVGAGIVPKLKQIMEEHVAPVQFDPKPVKVPNADTADQQRKMELSQQLITMFNSASVLDAMVKSCEDVYGEENSPEKLLKMNSNYFFGLNPRSSTWPRVLMIHRDYIRKSCAGLDPESHANMMTQAFAEGFTVDELQTLLSFYRSSVGTQSINLSNKANLKIQVLSLHESSRRGQRANEEFINAIQALSETERAAKSHMR